MSVPLSQQVRGLVWALLEASPVFWEMVLWSNVRRHSLAVCLKTAKQKPVLTQTRQPPLWFSPVSDRELVQALPISGMLKRFKGHRVELGSLCVTNMSMLMNSSLLSLPASSPPTMLWCTADATHSLSSLAFPHHGSLPCPSSSLHSCPAPTWVPCLHCLPWLTPSHLLQYSSLYPQIGSISLPFIWLYIAL